MTVIAGRGTLEVDADGPVWSKTATTAGQRDRLRRAARLHGQLTHPGVAPFVGLDDDAFSTVLRTRYVPGSDLWNAGPFTVEELCGLGAALAQTLAALHTAGVSHGALERAHVIVSDAGRPVLCGVGSGQIRGDDGTWASAVARDCTDLGVLLEGLLDEVSIPTGLIPALRARRCARDLRRVAVRASTGAIGDAPDLARQLSGLPGARLPGPVSTDRESSSSRRSTVSLRIAVGLALVGFACMALGVHGLIRAQTSRAEPPEVTPHLSTGSQLTKTRATGDLTDGGCRSSAVPDARLEGHTLVAGGNRYQVGQPDDLVRLGDWDGDGVATPALLRPSTGAVFLFDRWPAAGAPVRATIAIAVPDALDLICTGSPGDPTILDVRTTSGRLVPVPVPVPSEDEP